MISMTLPKSVVEKDKRLSKSADELMQLRWHWTLDPSNEDAVSFVEYARQVARDEKAIRRDANAWAAYQQSLQNKEDRAVRDETPGDFRAMENLSVERRQAARAVARAKGKKVATVARHQGKEVDRVIELAHNRAARNGTRVDAEIDRAAEWQAKAEKKAKAATNGHRRRHTACYAEVDRDLSTASRVLRHALQATDGVEFSEQEQAALIESIEKLRGLLNLVGLRFNGKTDIDWDKELQKLPV